ncbi:MAG: hypothetical protein R6T99_02100, partial [Bacteroidales bacterium]
FSDVGTAISAFGLAGSVGSAVTLSSNATKGDTTLSLDTSTLSGEDWLLLYSDTQRTLIPTYAGEIVRVQTIDDGSNLTLYGRGIKDTYTTADSASVKKITNFMYVDITCLPVQVMRILF